MPVRRSPPADAVTQAKKSARSKDVEGPLLRPVAADAPKLPHAPADDYSVSTAAPDLPAGGPASDVIPAAKLKLMSRHKLDVNGASGIVALGDDKFLVVNDDKGVLLAKADGKAKTVVKTKKHDCLDDLEGICRSPDGGHAFVISEATGAVVKLDVEEKKNGKLELSDPKEIGRLPDIDRVRNKGWEGIDLMPGALCADGRDRLVAVHEGNPRKIGVFTLPDLETDVLLKLPKDAKDHAYDLADIAVDPNTGRLFVLSDESATILELALVREQTTAPGALLENTYLELVAVTDLDISRKEKPEGLDFGPDGKLWVAMDGKARLYKFDVER